MDTAIRDVITAKQCAVYGYKDGSLKKNTYGGKMFFRPSQESERAQCEALLDINDTAVEFTMALRQIKNVLTLEPIGASTRG